MTMITSMRALAIVFVTISNCFCQSGVEFKYVKETVNFTAAKDSCELTSLEDTAKNAPPNAKVWLPLRKFDSTKWITINGDVYANEIVPKKSRILGQDCAVLRSEERIMDETFCHKKTKGYVCIDTDLGRCIGNGECLLFRRHNLTFFYESVSWFVASSRCYLKGGQLVTLDQQTFKLMTNELWKKLTHKGDFAVGVIKSGWMLDPTEDILKVYNWANHEPLPDKDCAIIDTSSMRWKGVNCYEKFSFVCDVRDIYQGSQADTTTTVSDTDEPEKIANVVTITERFQPETGSTAKMYLLLICLLPIVLLMIIGVILCKRRRSHQDKNRHDDEAPFMEVEDITNTSLNEREIHPKRRGILKNNWSKLQERIQIKGADLLKFLIEKEVITEANSTHIQSVADNGNQVDRLLNMIIKKNDEKFELFCDCLWDAKQEYIVKDLLYTEVDFLKAEKKLKDYIKLKNASVPMYTIEKEADFVSLEKAYVNTTWECIDSQRPRHILNSYSDMIEKIQSDEHKRIIISGISGTGKTLFMKHAANKWAFSQESPLQYYKLLVPIILRTVQEDMTLIDILRDQFPLLSCTEAYAIYKTMLECQEKVILIFDGYDELVPKTEINKIIKGLLFPKVWLIVTTRPHDVLNIKSIGGHNMHVWRTNGFNEKQIKDFIYCFNNLLKEESDDQEPSSLMKALQQDPYLMEMAKIPNQLEIMCTIWYEKKSLGKNIADLYECFVECLWFRMVQKQESRRENKSQSMDQYFSTTVDTLCTIANSWADNGTLQRSFIPSCLEKTSPNMLYILKNIGCLTFRSLSNEPNKSEVSFTHSTMQEYFVARQLGKSDIMQPDTLRIFSTVQRIERLEVILKFLCSINPTVLTKVLEPIIKNNKEKQECQQLILLLLKLVPEYESSDVSLPLPRYVDLSLLGKLSYVHGGKPVCFDHSTPAVQHIAPSKWNKSMCHSLFLLSSADRKSEYKNMKSIMLDNTAIKWVKESQNKFDISYVQVFELNIKGQLQEEKGYTENLLEHAKDSIKSLSITGIDFADGDSCLIRSPIRNLQFLRLQGKNVTKLAIYMIPNLPLLQIFVCKDTEQPDSIIFEDFCLKLNNCSNMKELHLDIQYVQPALLKLKGTFQIFLTIQVLDTNTYASFTEKLFQGTSSKGQELVNVTELQIKKVKLGGKNELNPLLRFMPELKKIRIGRKISSSDFSMQPYKIRRSHLNLRTICFTYINLKGQGNALKELLNSSPLLRIIEMSYCQLLQSDIQQLPRCENLVELRFAGNTDLADRKLNEVNLLKKATRLSLLDIGFCLFRTEDLLKSTCLEGLHYLDLKVNQDEDLLVAYYLRLMPLLKGMSVAECGCTAIEDLFRLIKNLPPQVKHFDVSDNDFGKDVVRVYEKADQLSRLSRLNICTGHQTDEIELIRRKLEEKNPDMLVYYEKSECLWSLYSDTNEGKRKRQLSDDC